MILKEWDDLPDFMKNDTVRLYYNSLSKKGCSLLLKRSFDIVMSVVMLITLSPIFVILSVIIKVDSAGPVFFSQTRVTQYGQRFSIYKFRTMVDGATQLGTQITVQNDKRVTRIGRRIRRCRLDELPQLLNILLGSMSFVGTRPEIPKYVEKYTDEMLATLLLPAGVTSEASICYKDEDKLLREAQDIDNEYINKVLPGKMFYNFKYLKEFNFFGELIIMVKTVVAVLREE